MVITTSAVGERSVENGSRMSRSMAVSALMLHSVAAFASLTEPVTDSPLTADSPSDRLILRKGGSHESLQNMHQLNRRSSIILVHEIDAAEMATNRDAPTAEQIADSAGGDIESAEHALLAVQFRDTTAE